MSQPMPALPWRPTEVHEGAKASRRLRALGLDADLLLGAIEAGDRGRQECSPYHPAQSRGQRMWADTTAGLRVLCIAHDRRWSIDREDNFETTYHNDFGLAIAVMGGDDSTGVNNPKRHPKVRRRRGPVTARRVVLNAHGTAPLFAHPHGKDDNFELTSTEELELWLLLISATPVSILSELSRPIGFTGTGKVGVWAERIILPPYLTVGGVTPLEVDGDDEEGGTSVLVTDK